MTQAQTADGAAFQRRRRDAGTLPALLEVLWVVAAIALLLPEFGRVAELGAGRDGRFAAVGFQIPDLPRPVLPAVCAADAALAEASLRERLCASVPGASAAAPLSRLPPELTLALSRSASAFLAPLKDARARLAALRLQQHEGLDGLRDAASAIAAVEIDIQPYVERFGLVDADPSGPLPLRCASRWIEAVLDEPSGAEPGGTSAAVSRANAVLLLAAALDGRSGVEALASAALLPRVRPRPEQCDIGGIAILSATAALMADARRSASDAHKNEAMLALLRSAGWQWAGAMLLGYGLLVWSRRGVRPASGVAVSLALWTIAAWVARVPWPLAGNREFEPARVGPSFWSPPSTVVVCLGALAALLFVAGLGHKRPTTAPAAPQGLSSRIGYAGLVLATGLGWLLLLDLSSGAHLGNRYLALYHQGHLWLGMTILSGLFFLRQPLSQGLGRGLSMAGETVRRASSRFGTATALAGALLLTAAALAAFGLALSNMRQLTSELGRVWLIVGAAWFFFLRGGPLAERLARLGPAGVSFWRYVQPLLWIVGVLIAAMFVTRDMGPLLIAGYASGAFLAASVAMWWQQRTGRRGWGFVLAFALFCAWIGVVTVALFRFGAIDSVTATRLESLATPFASTNDQLALVAWFQRATPPGGFGIGAVPWCGPAPAGSCNGVPAQIHSDYTFTAICGVFGAMAAWATSIACAVWLHRLIRHHGRVTRGEPLLVARAGHIGHDGQALLSWIGVAWVVLTLCQLAVTVAGNLAVLPLTGVTFPLVSFGMTSLIVNLAFLALCLNVDLPQRSSE